MPNNQPCHLCAALGESRFCDFDEQQEFPDECRELIMAMWFHEWHDLRRCPLCGQYYDFTYYIDNDIFQPTHTGEYRRVSTAEAEKMMKDEKARIRKQIRENVRKVKKRHGPVLETLTENEKLIVGYLTERLYASVSADDIEKSLRLDEHAVDAALAHLKKINVVSSSCDGPRGIDGLSVKLKKSEERTYTRFSISMFG